MITRRQIVFALGAGAYTITNDDMGLARTRAQDQNLDDR